MRKIFFTVCNYNAHKDGTLDRSLRYLSKIKKENIIISYFDNASKDDSESVLYDAYKNKLIDLLVISKKNMGKAYAMNSLFKQLCEIYKPSQDDILVNLDSDVAIMDIDFATKLLDVMSEIHPKYLGYQFFSDETMTVKSHIHNFVSNETICVNGTDYAVLKTQSGLGGGIIAMPIMNYMKVGGYNLDLGPNGTAAVYGGDDAILLYKLFHAFPDEKALCCIDKMVVHSDAVDPEYQKWKDNVNYNMCHNGFGNSTLPDKGFYD